MPRLRLAATPDGGDRPRHGPAAASPRREGGDAPRATVIATAATSFGSRRNVAPAGGTPPFGPAARARGRSRTTRLLRRLRQAPRRVVADAGGSVAVLVAILAPVLIGAIGLGSEVGYWYLTQRNVQNAADVAAHAAAKSKAHGGSASEMQSMAEYLVQEAGVDLAEATVTVNSPPATGSHTSDDAAVEVIVDETVSRLFSAIYSSDPVMISGRAVARSEDGGTGCVLALSPSTDGAITIAGSSDSSLSLCDMISNSAGNAFVMQGSGSSVSANCIQTVGTAQTTANLSIACDKPREHARPIPDPFADVAEPQLSGACQSATVGSAGTATVVTPVESHPSGMMSRRYCNGLTLKGNVTLGAGLYLIESGDFTIGSNATISGDGVVFYLADGVDLHFNGTATVDLSAPTSGPYAGMLIFGSRSATTASHLINGNLGSHLDGAIYAPDSHLEMSGSAATSDNSCTQIVTNTVTFSGNGAIELNCTNPSGPAINIVATTNLIE